MMTKDLDLADIQGNILQAFVSGYPAARFVFLRVTDAAKGRAFILDYRAKVTTALRWSDSGLYAGKIQATKPKVAINLAFSWEGFYALGLPVRTLQRMPPEFIEGMKARAAILGDDIGRNKPELWDPIWADRPHILVGLNALIGGTGKPIPELDAETGLLLQLAAKYGLVVMDGHKNANPNWQDACALLIQNDATFLPVPQEHFGFVDGISNPVFEGQFGDTHADYANAVGNGKILPTGEWAPLATGEFLVGHPDEAQETPDNTFPQEIMRNGTFLVYRKLHENVESFNAFIDATATGYGSFMGVSKEDASNIIKAKMAGRWPDGVPLSVAPTIKEWHAFNSKRDPKNVLPLADFKYGDDPEGVKCPVTSHTRRTNTRDGLTGTSSALNNRRRILRRGLPYGVTSNDDVGEHGILFMAMCSSLSRQFEFVQQQWINYGLDANAGNDTCPLIDNHSTGSGTAPKAKYVIPSDPKSGRPPFIVEGLPQFVEARGGEYFFVPSMTALRLMGMGIVDPT